MALPVSFSKKKVLVTGGGQGLGHAIVKKLYEDGATVFTVDKEEVLIEKLKQEFPEITAVKQDLADFDKTRELIESFGPLDLLVNNAAVFIPESFMEISADALNKTVDVNFKSLIVVGQAVAKGMIESKSGGSIVNISSTATRLAAPNLGVYSCCKAAVTMLTKVMSSELGSHNIRVNSISPTIMDTPMGRIPNPGQAAVFERSVIKRLLQPEEAADLVLFLLSPLAGMITGEDVVIDGGFTIR